MANEQREFLDPTGVALLWAKIKALPNNNTTYTLSQDTTDGHKFTLVGSDGYSATITIPDNNTEYSEVGTTGNAGLMTASDKVKLNGIETEANKTIVDSALSTSSTNPVQNNVINTAIGKKANTASPTFTGTPKAPTAAAGTNTTQIATTAFVTTAIANAIAGVSQIRFEIVATLPASGDASTIYLISNSGSGTNAYDEYIYVNNSWEKIGTTDVDLTNYMQFSDMIPITSAEIDAICV